MKPVLDSWPAKKRTTFFLPFVGGIWLLAFLVLAFATQNFALALLVPPLLAVGGALVLVGKPEIRMGDGRPLVEPRYKPYLFFVLAPTLAIVLYPIVGLLLTQAGLPPTKWLAIGSIVLALGVAGAASYLLVGFPDIVGSLRRQYAEIPNERRPYLFFPIAAVLFVLLYYTLGPLSTKALGRVADGAAAALLNVEVMILVPLSLVVASLVAWRLVGIPPVLTRPAHHLPKVTGKHRPRLFFGTALVAGFAFTVLVGAVLTAYAPLPATAVLAVAVVVGFAAGVGLAAAWWGTPARWRRYDDYTPGLHPKARGPLVVATALGVGLVVAVGIGLADIDLFWGLLAGSFASGGALLLLTGSHRHIAARRGEPTLVPDLPDGMKPLILFPTWLVTSLVLFAVLTYLLPGLVPVNALVSLLVGLGATFLLLEQPLLKDILADRREQARRRKEWEARRRERLAEAEAPKGDA